jgi:hypothetical protein
MNQERETSENNQIPCSSIFLSVFICGYNFFCLFPTSLCSLPSSIFPRLYLFLSVFICVICGYNFLCLFPTSLCSLPSSIFPRLYLFLSVFICVICGCNFFCLFPPPHSAVDPSESMARVAASRARQVSRPRITRQSYRPGPTPWPVVATRSGLTTSPIFRPVRSA